MALLNLTMAVAREMQTNRILIVILVAFAPLGMTGMQNRPSREYQIKAAFLYNFTQFVEWQPRSFPQQNSPLVIGILGDDPFGTYLDELVSGEKVKDHPLVVKRYQSVSEMNNCHVLFINFSNPRRYEKVFEDLKGKNILTVGDNPEFIAKGGMIQLLTDDNKTKLKINLEEVKDANIQISSKLLRLAEII